MTNQEKIDNLITDILYDDSIIVSQIEDRIKELMLDYGKYNVEKCLSDFKQTGTCLSNSIINLNKFLTNN